MTFDAAFKLLIIAYAVVGIAVFVLGMLFTVVLFAKVIRRMR